MLPAVVLLRSVGMVNESIALPDFLVADFCAAGFLAVVDLDLVDVDLLLLVLALADFFAGLTSVNLGEDLIALRVLDFVLVGVVLALVDLVVTLVVLDFGLAPESVLFLVAGFLEVDFASGM